VGFLSSFTGLLIKLRHWPFGHELIMIGAIVCGIAFLCIIVNFILLKKPLE